MVRDIAAQCLFHGFHSLTLTGMLPHAFQLWSNPFSGVQIPLSAKHKKKHPYGCFF